MSSRVRQNMCCRILLAAVFASLGLACDGPSGGPSSGAAGDGSAAPHRGTTGAEANTGALDEAAYAGLRLRMVEQISSASLDRRITSACVLEAMRNVPRHEFVTPELKRHSYENNSLPIAENQDISQPYIVALMTELLELKATDKVLEIGTGSGYQAAVLGEIASEIHTVEIRPQLLESAKQTLEKLKTKGILHYRKLEAHVGDGNKGFPAAAPYDAIVVTAAPKTLPVELLNQLKPGGRMVIPIGDFVQELQLIRKSTDGTYSEESIVPVRFVRMDSK